MWQFAQCNLFVQFQTVKWLKAFYITSIYVKYDSKKVYRCMQCKAKEHQYIENQNNSRTLPHVSITISTNGIQEMGFWWYLLVLFGQ